MGICVTFEYYVNIEGRAAPLTPAYGFRVISGPRQPRGKGCQDGFRMRASHKLILQQGLYRSGYYLSEVAKECDVNEEILSTYFDGTIASTSHDVITKLEEVLEITLPDLNPANHGSLSFPGSPHV